MGVESERIAGRAGEVGSPSPPYLAVPLNEIAFGVRFVAPDFDLVHFGQYFETVKEAFSERQMVPSIAIPQFPAFGAQTIQISTLPRLWLVRESRLIQLQTDRFIYNWRRVDDSPEKYPGFVKIFAEFRERWSAFIAFSRDAFKIPLKVAELSLTYVNQIHDDGSIAAPIFEFRNDNLDMPAPELWVSQLRFAYPEANMKITVGARPAIHLATQAPVEQLDMTVESISAPANDAAAIIDWYEQAHTLVHHTFKTLIHADWRKKWGFVSE